MRKSTIIFVLMGALMAALMAAPIAAVSGVGGIAAAGPPGSSDQKPSESSAAQGQTQDHQSQDHQSQDHNDARAAGRGRLGFAALQISPELRTFFGAPADRGILVQQVRPDRPAALAGLHVGDVVLEVDGDAVRSARDVIDAIADRKKGEAVTMQIERGKQPMTLRATLVDRAAPRVSGARRLDDGTWEELEPGNVPFDVRQFFGDAGTRRELEDTRRRLEALERRLEALEHR
jgi:membrane-associated protease RseP (regulator of RpoE activity)